MDKNAKVLVLMSGGVDSSVAAALIREQGYQVNGVTMKIWSGSPATSKGIHHGCYGPEEDDDIEDARRVAEGLGIPYHVIDLTYEYQSVVLDYFSQEYICGRTPNPCVRCNHRIKFGALIGKARQTGLEFDYIASGHYAGIEYDRNLKRYLLKKARDSTKDQSYFLSFLSQEQLSRLILPLNSYSKNEVRQIAHHFGLEVADKPDSQNFVCGDYSSIIQADSSQGDILDESGKVLGRHTGIHNYTIGQRKGLGLSSVTPLYVTAIDPARNIVIVGKKEKIYKNEFIASQLNWIAINDPEKPFPAGVKIRSSHKEAAAWLTPENDENIRVQFQEPQLAITPGQVAAFYRGNIVLGSGIITG